MAMFDTPQLILVNFEELCLKYYECLSTQRLADAAYYGLKWSSMTSFSQR